MGAEMPHVDIFTDGACRGNPGTGGYGVVMEFTEASGQLHVRELSAGYANTTNNRMELLGVISGLEMLKKPCRVQLFTDSKYVADAFNQHWVDGWIRKGWKKSDGDDVKNVALWKRLVEAKSPHDVTFIWIKGHAGHPQNERCDELATLAADSDRLLPDNLGD